MPGTKRVEPVTGARLPESRPADLARINPVCTGGMPNARSTHAPAVSIKSIPEWRLRLAVARPIGAKSAALLGGQKAALVLEGTQRAQLIRSAWRAKLCQCLAMRAEIHLARIQHGPNNQVTANLAVDQLIVDRRPLWFIPGHLNEPAGTANASSSTRQGTAVRPAELQRGPPTSLKRGSKHGTCPSSEQTTREKLQFGAASLLLSTHRWRRDRCSGEYIFNVIADLRPCLDPIIHQLAKIRAESQISDFDPELYR